MNNSSSLSIQKTIVMKSKHLLIIIMTKILILDMININIIS